MRLTYRIVLYIFCVLMYASCSPENDLSPEPNTEKPPSEEPDYPWEEERTELLSTQDMVLIYGGSAHCRTVWDQQHFSPYVTYADESGKEHWLFDGFLFLEIHNGNGKMFASGYTDTPANQKNWGTLQNGKMLDFSLSVDRISACKWYIDYVRKKFKEQNYAHLELAGFYWIAEEATNTRTIVRDIAAYLNELKYSFNWIPYFNSDGYNEWKNLRFNYAFLQPNYFFNESVPYSRLDVACQLAFKNGMDMEVEFDENVLNANGRSDRLSDYMKAFRDNGICDSKRLAYYQGDAALYLLSVSTNLSDRKLYHDFCHFVVEHAEK